MDVPQNAVNSAEAFRRVGNSDTLVLDGKVGTKRHQIITYVYHGSQALN